MRRFLGITVKRVVLCLCLDRHVKEPYTMSMAWEPDRRSNFFFSPPAHLCAVTCITEISLIVRLSNQYSFCNEQIRCHISISGQAQTLAVTYIKLTFTLKFICLLIHLSVCQSQKFNSSHFYFAPRGMPLGLKNIPIIFSFLYLQIDFELKFSIKMCYENMRVKFDSASG